MEECVNDKVYDKNEKNDEEKEVKEAADSESTKIDEGKGVNNESGGEDVDLVHEVEFNSRASSESLNEKYDLVGELDPSTLSGDSFYNIFYKEE